VLPGFVAASSLEDGNKRVVVGAARVLLPPRVRDNMSRLAHDKGLAVESLLRWANIAIIPVRRSVLRLDSAEAAAASAAAGR
jgi:hypothetical protein